MARYDRDYDKCVPCPDCGLAMHGLQAAMTAANPSGVVWVCKGAIGEWAFDKERRSHYFPPGSTHRGWLRFYREARSGLLPVERDEAEEVA